MGSRSQPQTVPEQIADIYEQLRGFFRGWAEGSIGTPMATVQTLITDATADTTEDGSASTGAADNATYFRATCDTTADVLLAANSTRHRAILRNIGTIDAFLGWDSGVDGTGGSTPGVLVRAGDVIELKHTAAVYGITDSGSATFAGWEEYD